MFRDELLTTSEPTASIRRFIFATLELKHTMTTDRIGFIGGGQMAKALAGGAVRAGLVKPEQLLIAEPNAQQKEQFTAALGNVQLCDHGHEVLAACDRVVLAVKPQVLQQIGGELGRRVESRHLLVSIAAGISLVQLQELFSSKRIVRVMPNTPSQVGAGAAGIAADGNVSETDIAWVEQLMNAVGTSVRVPDRLLHAVTGVSGSGPAYIYLVIEALSDGGVAQGLPRDLATKLAAQTVLGAAKMVLDTGLHPGQLKDQVTSPAGTTIAALRHLEQAGLRSALIEAVAAAAERSEELGSV
jgi:pyrroline-5-carboxylate reductase